MFEFILKYWIQFIMSGMAAGIVWILKILKNKLEHEEKCRRRDSDEQSIMKEAILALLHDRLYQTMAHYISKGNITLKDLDNLDYLYRGYKSLGGNGMCEDMYNRIKTYSKIIP